MNSDYILLSNRLGVFLCLGIWSRQTFKQWYDSILRKTFMTPSYTFTKYQNVANLNSVTPLLISVRKALSSQIKELVLEERWCSFYNSKISMYIHRCILLKASYHGKRYQMVFKLGGQQYFFCGSYSKKIYIYIYFPFVLFILQRYQFTYFFF
jgi:hypothetical protein